MAIEDLLNKGPKAFRTGWLGYDRAQVDEEYARLEGQLHTACADRDAALATAEDCARHLEQARSELAEYRMIHAGHSKDNAVSGCIRYLLHTAKRKAEEIEAEARVRAEEAVDRAEEAVGRHAVLLDETEQETQRRLAEAGRRAREIVGEALEQSRVMLADLAERQRLLDQWYAEVATAPDMPLPRRPEATPVEAELSTAERSTAERSTAGQSTAERSTAELSAAELSTADTSSVTR